MDDIDFLEERIKDCYSAMRHLESLDFYNYNNARKRRFNQKNVNSAFDVIFKIKKQLEWKKIKLERNDDLMDLDEEELQETRKINKVGSGDFIAKNYIKKDFILKELDKLYEIKLSDTGEYESDIAILYKIEALQDLLQKYDERN